MDQELMELFQEYHRTLQLQKFDMEKLDYSKFDTHLNYLKMLHTLDTASVSVFDMAKLTHLYHSENFGALLGYDFTKLENGDEFLDSRKHPDDAKSTMRMGIYYLKRVLDIPKSQRKAYKMVSEFRMMNSEDRYIRVSERFQILEMDDDGNIWLVLSVLDLAADQNVQLPYRGQAINFETGEVMAYEVDGLKEQSPLSTREVEVLNLIGTGKLSKEIADQLNISVHTVNTHRQRIIEKLNVGNTIEALNFASQRGIIG